MWDRKILKSNAKTALRGRYWLAFAVALVASLLAGKLFAGGLNPWSWGQLGEAASSIEEQITPYDEPYYYDYYGDFGGYGATWTHGATLMGADLTMDTTPPMAIPMGMALARMTAWSSLVGDHRRVGLCLWHGIPRLCQQPGKHGKMPLFCT